MLPDIIQQSIEQNIYVKFYDVHQVPVDALVR